MNQRRLTNKDVLNEMREQFEFIEERPRKAKAGKMENCKVGASVAAMARSEDVEMIMVDTPDGSGSADATGRGPTSDASGNRSRQKPDPASVCDKSGLAGAIESAVAKALQTTPLPKPTRKWAQTAAAASPEAWQQVNTKAIPRRRNREVLVHGAGLHEDLRKRKPLDILLAVNTEPQGAEAIAARKLRSGDVVVTFTSKIPENINQGGLVIAKGVPAERLKQIHQDNELLKAVQDKYPEVGRCKRLLSKSPASRFASVLLFANTFNAAHELVENGFLWEAQIFNCEPFIAEKRISNNVIGAIALDILQPIATRRRPAADFAQSQLTKEERKLA
ncbi:hypothetical protein NPX13_g10770 [Xylaria arbuscula]|uniref:Uncharacterized protein n=1 Tax=Xylaria arbuscula TaxID=114810 RepID=A0A9W8N465_9PEZI|nr:hypothetical protein NPX13_g10770 [Xylaria arbuscula]